ncbi:MAG TPA: NAD(P)-binding domain-containing protein [Acidimicrobiia bacterium]|nr:NAD(P)-binding domain-containing protein [Acidimicrobiia bacterium]
MGHTATEQLNTLVIGGGQAGLAVGYHLQRAGVPFLIVDANHRTGDSWRNRWDSLRLFTPNRFNSLPGLTIRGADWDFPTKDELAEYLESYAAHFELPIRHGVKVDRLSREGDGFKAVADHMTFEADNVIVAMASYQVPKTPAFATELDSRIVQLHVDDYRNPGQLQQGGVLVVGLGNSGAEIAKELAGDRKVWLSGEPSAVQPFRPERLSGRLLMPIVGPVILNRVLTTSTPMGRRARSKMLHKAAPLLRVKPRDLVAAGVQRVGRVTGVLDGYPQMEDGSVLDVSNVVWCTGFDPGFSWIDLPVFDQAGDVIHRRGVVDQIPGLYFVALKFLHSFLSDTLLTVGRDAGYVVDHLVGRQPVSHSGSTSDSMA